MSDTGVETVLAPKVGVLNEQNQWHQTGDKSWCLAGWDVHVLRIARIRLRHNQVENWATNRICNSTETKRKIMAVTTLWIKRAYHRPFDYCGDVSYCKRLTLLSL